MVFGSAFWCEISEDARTLAMADESPTSPFVASAAKSSKIVKGAQLKVYPGAPHGLTSTRKDEFQADLLQILQS